MTTYLIYIATYVLYAFVQAIMQARNEDETDLGPLALYMVLAPVVTAYHICRLVNYIFKDRFAKGLRWLLTVGKK